MDQPKGALVAQVLDDSPAAKSELQVGDVILSFNGRDVATSGTSPPLVGASRVTSPRSWRCCAGAAIEQVEVVIGELPEEGDEMISAVEPEATSANSIGLVVGELDCRAAQSARPGAGRRHRPGGQARCRRACRHRSRGRDPDVRQQAGTGRQAVPRAARWHRAGPLGCRPDPARRRADVLCRAYSQGVIESLARGIAALCPSSRWSQRLGGLHRIGLGWRPIRSPRAFSSLGYWQPRFC